MNLIESTATTINYLANIKSILSFLIQSILKLFILARINNYYKMCQLKNEHPQIGLKLCMIQKYKIIIHDSSPCVKKQVLYITIAITLYLCVLCSIILIMDRCAEKHY